MSILRKLFKAEVRDTGYRMPEEPRPTFTEVNVRERPDLSSLALDFRNVYRLSVSFHNQFAANPAERERALRYAEQEMLHTIYGPVFNKLDALRKAAWDRDFREVMRLVDGLEKELKGDD